MANIVKQIKDYSEVKKGMLSRSKNKAAEEKTTKINENDKKSSKEYIKFNINNINIKQEENLWKFEKKLFS